MDCMLIPENPTAPLAKVPYLPKYQWDGGSFLKYPIRMGKPQMLPDLEDPAHIPWEISEHAQPTPIKELEAFFQTWLFFGLLAEVLDANEVEEPVVLPESEPAGPEPEPARSEAEPAGPEHVPQITESSPQEAFHRKRKSKIIKKIYKDFIVEEDGQQYLTTRHLLQVLTDSWSVSPIEFIATRDMLAARYKRLRPSLFKVHFFYNHLPAHFDPVIKDSIGVIGEVIGNAMLAVCLLTNSKEWPPNEWGSTKFFTEQVKERMRQNGWCPSDLARAMSKFKTFQTQHFVSLLDKRLPQRSHVGCDEEFCQAYQIDEKTYGLDHAEEGCECKHIAIDNVEVVKALKHGESLPLLRFVGEKEDLKIEVVTSTKQTPYVALSHVWADGLGNPKGNELHACKLVRLRKLIAALPPLQSLHGPKVPNENTPLLDSTETREPPLLWLDTLCCPVAPRPAKMLSLTKMRPTYKLSTAVLVLDASLQCYDSKSMTPIEMLVRIFTSSWLRRLWTLQEGALASHLYFQFADRAISLETLKATMDEELPELRLRIMASDMRNEVFQIQQFFRPGKNAPGGPNLQILDDALKHRGVSVPTDEPLCIGTLMSLPEKPILAVSESDRMRVVWELLAKKFSSIPAQIIFFEEKRLTAPGFRWAPASFLRTEKTIFDQSTRQVRWNDEKPGYPTPKGLKVSYPGFRLSRKSYDDGKPRHPWKGLKRISETKILFRDTANGEWFFIATKRTALQTRDLSSEELIAYGTQNLFPLHTLMHDESKEIFVVSPQDQLETPHFQRNAVDGVLVDGKFEKPQSSIWGSSCLPRQKPTPKTRPVLARTLYQTMVAPLSPVESVLQAVAEPFAMQLRADPITDELLAIEDQEGEEYKAVLERIKTRMKEMMESAYLANPMLKLAIERTWGEGYAEYMWPTIGDWFNHGFWGTRLAEDQVWFID